MKALRFALAHRHIDIVGITHLLFFHSLLVLMQLGLGPLDSGHEVDQAMACRSAHVLEHGLVIVKGFRVDGEFAAQFFE